MAGDSLITIRRRLILRSCVMNTYTPRILNVNSDDKELNLVRFDFKDDMNDTKAKIQESATGTTVNFHVQCT